MIQNPENYKLLKEMRIEIAIMDAHMIVATVGRPDFRCLLPMAQAMTGKRDNLILAGIEDKGGEEAFLKLMRHLNDEIWSDKFFTNWTPLHIKEAYNETRSLAQGMAVLSANYDILKEAEKED